MPIRRKPAYQLHKASGRAKVRIDGKDTYLGAHGTTESREQYDDLIAEWTARNGDTSVYTLTIADLAILYLKHARTHYRKNGKETSEVGRIQIALRHLVKLSATARVRDFGPKALMKVRQSMIDADYARTSINIHVGRIRRMFKWGVAQELVSPEKLVSLQAVVGLQAGRSDARESEPVKPVHEDVVAAIEPFVTSPIWAMVQVQQLTGCRPGEVTSMRGCDLNMSGKVWEYVPESHKTEHHGKQRMIFLGPAAQKIVREFLKPNLEAYLFSPRDGRSEFVGEIYRDGAATARAGKRQPGERYSVNTYQGAIRKACIKANIPHWHPNQLRHSAATNIRRKSDLDTVRTVLGHASAVTSEIYAEADHGKARDIIAKIG